MFINLYSAICIIVSVQLLLCCALLDVHVCIHIVKGVELWSLPTFTKMLIISGKSAEFCKKLSALRYQAVV